MLLYTRTIIQTKMTPRTIVTISHSVRNAGGFFSIASNQPMPPTAKDRTAGDFVTEMLKPLPG